MNDTSNKDTNQSIATGSQNRANKNNAIRKLVAILVIVLIVVVGGMYLYGMYNQGDEETATITGVEANPDEFKFDYDEKERQQRLRQLKNKSSEDFSSDEEYVAHYQEFNVLLAQEGRCDEFEENLEKFSSDVAIDADSYLALARCYETNDGDQTDINRVADKAESSLSESESEEDKAYFEDRIRYYRSLDV